jgi:hypothetical protein
MKKHPAAGNDAKPADGVICRRVAQHMEAPSGRRPDDAPSLRLVWVNIRLRVTGMVHVRKR